MTWLSQYYFTAVGLPLVYFGVVWSLLVLSLVPASFFAHRIEEVFGKRRSLFLITSLPIIGFFLLSLVDVIYGIAILFLFYLARGFGSVVLSDYVNVLIPSTIRATVLSVQALMMRLVFLILGPIIGWMSDVYSIQMALFASGCIFLCLSSVSLFFLAQNTNLDI